jgi:NAD(P)-dependent dehydrogenase (short-subunit alcohol dehydrogenase family)
MGRAIAQGFAAAGWRIAIHYRNSEADADKLVSQINAAPGPQTAVALKADLSAENETSQLVQQASAELGPLCCLINNASHFQFDDIESVSRASWDQHLETNLRAPLVLAQAFAKQLPNGNIGNIINILDQRVLRLTPLYLSYTVSKSALWTLTQTLAQALAPRIRVNAIGPGPTLRSAHQSADGFSEQVKATALGRQVSPEEISAGVQFILSAPSMTGQMIALDSGQHLSWKTQDNLEPDAN